VATTLPHGSKDWSKAGAPMIGAITTIPMNFCRTHSMVAPDDERCHQLVCALKQIGMCEAEHSTRSFLTAIPAAKFETSAFGQSGSHDKFEQCPYLNTGHSPLTTTIRLRQRKTGAYVSIPVADALKAALDPPVAAIPAPGSWSN
jgi:hypothetical protein